MVDGDASARRGFKVARIGRKYGLDDFDRDLRERWTRETDRYSLRDLADFFNKRILRAAIEAADVGVLDGEVDNLYRLLTAEDVSGGARTQARKRLERQGIDPAELEDDFVSYGSVNRYLKEALGVDGDPTESAAPAVSDRADRVYAVQNRTAAVTENTIEQLRKDGSVDLGRFDVFVDISVVCHDCGRSIRVADLFDGESCRCTDGT